MIEFSELAFQIILSAFLGAAIGFEREYRRKSAGLRTYTLVAVGATLFTMVSVHGFLGFPGGEGVDISRIASQVVIGIGFIAAGLIFLKEDKVQGLTTAAGIWIVAALGMTTALGLYSLAIFSTFLTLIVLVFLRSVEDLIPRA